MMLKKIDKIDANEQSNLKLALPERCDEVVAILGRVADKWTVVTVMLLTAGSMRFNELKRRIGSVSGCHLPSVPR